MREIKFRAWDGKIMHKWGFLQEGIFAGPPSSNRGNFQTMKHMQFTGLKDKNGKEIFEGDIVKYGYADFEEDKTIHQVKYMGYQDYPAFDLDPNLGCDSNGLSHATAEGELEVIGNLYENPDLLTSKES